MSEVVQRIVRMPEIKARTGLSRQSIERKWNAESKYFDPAFPAKLKLGARAVGVSEAALIAWCESRGLNVGGGASC